MKALAILLLAGSLVTQIAVATQKKHPAKPSAKATATKSLYDRLGGKDAITAVVDQFITNCATDDRIKSFFAATAADNTKLTAFKSNLINQICQAAGGPCKYTGK